MAGSLEKGHALGGVILGALKLMVALIVIVCSFVLSGKANLSSTMTPYWAGIPFIFPGILGVVSGITKSKCAMIAYMVLNIICFILQGVGTILVAIVVAIWAAYAKNTSSNCSVVGYKHCRCHVDGRTRDIYGIEKCDDLQTISTLLYVITSFLVIGAILSLAGSILGCIAVCCSNKESTTIIVQQPVGMQPYGHQPPSYQEKH